MTQALLCVDPGPETSGVLACVPFDLEHPILFYNEKMDNDVLLYKIQNGDFDEASQMIIETIFSTYSPIGYEQSRTMIFTGRLVQQWCLFRRSLPIPILRTTVSHHLCPHNKKITDSMVTASLNIRYGEPATPKRPCGPLKGLKSHAYQALAVGVAYADGARSTFTIRGKKYLASYGELDEVSPQHMSNLRLFG